jgi:hypothetical protein
MGAESPRKPEEVRTKFGQHESSGQGQKGRNCKFIGCDMTNILNGVIGHSGKGLQSPDGGRKRCAQG